MPDRRQLTEAFYRAYPSLRNSTVHPLRASCDMAVAQFRGHLNSVGFLALYTCPGATAVCAQCCYTEGGQAGFPAAKDLRARNTHTLLQLLHKRAVQQLADQLGSLMDHAHAHYERRRLSATGTDLRRLQRGSLFRHNWSGDIVDATHARAIQRACMARPHIDSWIYTRSFDLLEYLEPLPSNLTVWVSEDADNQHQASRALRRFPWARSASLVCGPVIAKPGDLVCPKLRHRPGSSAPVLPYQHACTICRICTMPSDKVSRVLFPAKTHHNQNPPPKEVGDYLHIEPYRHTSPAPPVRGRTVAA